MLLLRTVAASEIEQPTSVDDFLKNNCLDCHEGNEADGGLDLEKLDVDLTSPTTMARWVRIFDRVHDGEMPPEEAGELDADIDPHRTRPKTVP